MSRNKKVVIIFGLLLIACLFALGIPQNIIINRKLNELEHTILPAIKVAGMKHELDGKIINVAGVVAGIEIDLGRNEYAFKLCDRGAIIYLTGGGDLIADNTNEPLHEGQFVYVTGRYALHPSHYDSVDGNITASDIFDADSYDQVDYELEANN